MRSTGESITKSTLTAPYFVTVKSSCRLTTPVKSQAILRCTGTRIVSESSVPSSAKVRSAAVTRTVMSSLVTAVLLRMPERRTVPR